MSAREPLWSVAGLTAAATAVIALLVAFGVPLTEEQQVAILGVVAVFGPLFVAVAARRFVTPNDSVVERDDDGLVIAGPANDTVPEGGVIRSKTTGDVFTEGPRRAYPQDTTEGH